MVSTLLLVFLFQQAGATPHPVSVKTFEDIEIGMPETAVVESLRRAGYTVPDLASSGRIVELNGKIIGTFFTNDGRITSASETIYSSSSGDGPIELAEALYWLLQDEGSVTDSNDKDVVWTETIAELKTAAFVGRGSYSIKRIDIRTKSGALYLINLSRCVSGPCRLSPNLSGVEITKETPFLKK
jgi:hypothetical protein